MKYLSNEILSGYPKHHQVVSKAEIDRERGDRVVVVLDDDPTGTQTVYNTPVLTEWTKDTLDKEFRAGTALFYILTNSRSMPADSAVQINREIVKQIKDSARRMDKSFLIISRSDSTLRGHFPLETETIADVLGWKKYLLILNPAFFEGGRYTVDNQHYVLEGDFLIRAEDTPFANDATFGFSNGNLVQYVIEKSKGQIQKEDIFDLGLTELRTKTIEELTKKIVDNNSKKILIINAIDYDDESIAIASVLTSINLGMKVVFRTAASTVPVIGGIEQRALLKKNDFKKNRSGGLIAVGSYVPKTTAQIDVLRASADIVAVELNVKDLLDDNHRMLEISRVSVLINKNIRTGRDVLFFTSRHVVTDKSKEGSLRIVNLVSRSMVSVIQRLACEPSFFIAKGGITSSDIATKGLGVKRAMVRGQILAGVPVWSLGGETKFPGMDYVVFPGNVGDDRSLLEAYTKLK